MKELLITLLAGLFFLVGVTIAYFSKNNKKLISFSIALAFAVLILLLIFDILPECFELIKNKTIITITGGALLGIGILMLVEKCVPHHDHYEELDHHENHLHHIGIMTSVALIIHNIVEGIGIYGIAESSIKSGIIYAVGVGMHNIPFGIEITAMLNKLSKKSRIIYIIFLTISTFIGGLLIFLLKDLMTDFILGVLLSVTVGMIIYLLFFELLTELKENFSKYSIYGFITGIIFIIIGMFI